MRGYSHGYKRDLSDRSNLAWSICRRKGAYIVAKVESRLDGDGDVIIPHVEPAYGPFERLTDARASYAAQDKAGEEQNDVVELQRLQQAMQQEDDAYASLLASNPTGAFLIGLDGRREYL